MRVQHITPVLVAALSGAALLGCSSPDSQGSPPGEVTPPVGTQLLVGGALTLRGMTSDGWVVYSDNDTLTLHAAPIAGGDATDIVTLGDSFAISVWFDVVFAWSNKNEAGVGPLTVWKSSTGPHAVATASLAPWVAASIDGSTILYLDGVDAAGNEGNLVAAAADGTGTHEMLHGLTQLSQDGCQALLGFAGSYAIGAHCDAGASRATISSFEMPSWKRADIVSAAANTWVTDPQGTVVLTATDAGTVVVPIAGGSPTVIDPMGSYGVFTADGRSAIYGASSNELRRSSVTAPNPVTLVSGGVGGLYALSPDDAYALYYQQLDPVHLVSDMYLASASKPGTPLTLSATQTAAIYGDPFTADSSHALYSTDVDTMLLTSTLNALELGGSAAPVALATDISSAWAATGAKVMFTDHYAWTGSRGHADVRTVDTSTGAAATLIVNQADSEVFLSPAHDKVVYTWSLDDSSRAGVYVADIP